MRYRGRLEQLTLCFWLISGPSHARAQTPPDVAVSRVQVAVTRTSEPVTLDGRLDEAAWALAGIATDFVQTEPHEGQPATEVTHVRILYDADNLYFGVYCFQSDPRTVIVNQLNRDFAITDTDVFGISLDPFHDRRNTFIFFTNPGGAQRDEQSFDDGRFQNLNWDGIWHVATQIQDDGWSAEIRIPFKTLRFRESAESFGVNFYRNIRYKNEQVYWSPVPRRFSLARASLSGDLLALQGIRPGTSLRLKPAVVTRLEHRSGPSTDTRVEPEFSLDGKYGLTQGLTLDLTYNPEFSQVEVDAEQINLSRFNLFFPEKRDFFLENEGFFHFGDIQGERGPNPQSEMRLFYSRRIGLSDNNQPISILGGARLSGRAGPYTLGLLNIQQEDSGGLPARNFSVVRIRRHLLSNSDIGVAYVGREGSGDYNRAYGVDANFQFHQNLTTNFYLAKTDSPELTGNSMSTKAGIQWTDSFKTLQFIVTDTGEHFNPEAGFIERPGLRHYRGSFELNPRPKSNRFIRGFEPHAVLRASTDRTNRLVSRDDHWGVFIDFHDGGRAEVGTNRAFERLDEPFEIRSGISIPIGDYSFNEYFASYNTNRSSALATSLSFRRSTFWGGDLTTLRTSVYVVRGPRLNASLSYNVNQVDLPGGEFTAGLTGLKVDYAFNPRAFLSSFIQYNNDSERWITNVRFRLIHRPLSDIFLVYTDDNPLGGRERFRAFLVKYTHAFEF